MNLSSIYSLALSHNWYYCATCGAWVNPLRVEAIDKVICIDCSKRESVVSHRKSSVKPLKTPEVSLVPPPYNASLKALPPKRPKKQRKIKHYRVTGVIDYNNPQERDRLAKIMARYQQGGGKNSASESQIDELRDAWIMGKRLA